MQQQVAAQLSAPLQLAHVLRLQQLLDVLHSFVLQNVGTATSCLLAGVVGLVFSDAVLEAALGNTSTFSKEAYISSMLSQPCSLTPGNIGCSSLLKPVGPKRYDTQNEVLVFNAELLRDFAGARAGDTVKVTLDLFGKHYEGGQGGIKLQLRNTMGGSSFVALAHVRLPAQLLLGYTFSDAAALENFMNINPFE